MQAFERVIRPHVASVRRFAFSFCNDWVEADDLAQEALLKAYRSIATFRGDASLATWLYSVARTTFIDSRRGRLAKLRALETELPEAPPGGQPGPEELLAARGEVAELWDAIRQLEPRFRIPLVLFEIEGMSYEHVASIEQVPVGTVRSRLARARRKLVEILNVERSADGAAGTDTAVSSSPQQGSRCSP